MGRESVYNAKWYMHRDRNFCSYTKSVTLGQLKAIVCKMNLLSLKVNQDWIGHLHIKFTVAEYTGDIYKWLYMLHLLKHCTSTDVLYSLHIVGLVQLTNYITVHFKTCHSTHFEACSSTGVVHPVSNLSMWCCCWDPTGSSAWTAWHLLPVLSCNPAISVSSLSCSVPVM